MSSLWRKRQQPEEPWVKTYSGGEPHYTEPVPKRFCTTCQSYQPEEGGYKKPGITRGWRCATCLQRKSVSIYSSKKGKS